MTGISSSRCELVMCRVAILISGRGSNMTALIDAARAESFPAEIALVISNKSDAPGLANARAAGVATLVIESKPFGKDRAGFEKVLQAALDEHTIDRGIRAALVRPDAEYSPVAAAIISGA
jgi:phosphoribosylglycinamide formyltransferase-1